MCVEASIIIPVHNQATRLWHTLASLVYQEPALDRTCEVIVVDDGSTDACDTVLNRFAGLLPLRVIRQAHLGRSAARNSGIHGALGKTLLFTDADRPVATTWVRQHILMHSTTHNSVGVGDILEVYRSEVDAMPVSQLTSDLPDIPGITRRSRVYSYWRFIRVLFNDIAGDAMSRLGWLLCLSGNLSLSKATVLKEGSLNETLRSWGFEHFEWGFRLARHGSAFRYVPHAPNYHLAHARGGSFYSQSIAASVSELKCAGFPPELADGLGHLIAGRLSLGELYRIAGGTSPLPAKQWGTYVFNAPLWKNR